MTPFQVITTLMLLVLTLASCWIVYTLRELTSAVRLLFRPPVDSEIPDEAEGELEDELEDQEGFEEPEQVLAPNQKPLPVDPAHPPYNAVYRPTSHELSPICVCHKRQIKVDQPVMMWPVPGTDAREFWVFCEDAAS